MDWFRFYHDALDDPKVQLLSAETFKRWVNVLCLASRQPNEARGTLPEIERVALALRISVDEARELLRDLKKAKLVDRGSDGVLRPHNWGKRQQRKPSDEPERVKERVERHRVTRSGAPGNASDEHGIAAVTRYSGDSPALPPVPPIPPLKESEQEGELEEKHLQTPSAPVETGTSGGTHPAIVLWCQIRETELSETSAKAIADAVDRTPDALRKWREVVEACEVGNVGKGNVKCAIDWLRKGVPDKYRLTAPAAIKGAEPPPLPEFTPEEAEASDRAREEARRLVQERLRTAKGPLAGALGGVA